MAGIDPSMQDEILEALQDDELFKKYAREVAKRALLVQLQYLENGTPQERQQAARAFMPLFTKLLTESDNGNSGEVAAAKVRNMLGSILTPKKKPKEQASE